MNVINTITEWIKTLAETLPLELFVIIGGFVEEVVGPIPSPLVMTSAGTIALTQGHTFLYVLLLSFLGGIGKTLAAWLLYILGHKAEYWIVGRWGRLLGLSHESVASLTKRLTGHGAWDDLALFVLRALPILPAAPVSVLCGVLRLPLKSYLSMTFLGYSMRNLFFLSVGFVGADAYRAIIQDIRAWEAVLWIASILAVFALGVWLYTHAKRGWWERTLERLFRMIRRGK